MIGWLFSHMFRQIVSPSSYHQRRVGCPRRINRLWIVTLLDRRIVSLANVDHVLAKNVPHSKGSPPGSYSSPVPN